MKAIQSGKNKNGKDLFIWTCSEQEANGLMFGMDNMGLCRFCGEEADGVEPDARGYDCECCGERGVYGFEEAMIRGWVTFEEESESSESSAEEAFTGQMDLPL